MLNQIIKNLKGANVTIGVTGLPVTFSGEIINSSDVTVIGLKTADGIKVYFNPDLIAFIY